MWRCGDLDSWPDLLSDSSGDQPLTKSPTTMPFDAARGVLQRSDETHSHRGENFVRDARLREGHAEDPKLVAILPLRNPKEGASVQQS